MSHASRAPEDTGGFSPNVCGCHMQDGYGLDEGGARALIARDNQHTLKRLRRIEGQVRGLARMIDDNRYCADVMTQISSAHEALRAVARELMRSHARHCIAAESTSRGRDERLFEELIEMMYKLSR